MAPCACLARLRFVPSRALVNSAPTWRPTIMKRIAAFIAVAAMCMPGAAAAADFYQGKTIRMLVGSAPGGGYDSYARTFVQYLRKHIPGDPTIVVQNMPGA